MLRFFQPTCHTVFAVVLPSVASEGIVLVRVAVVVFSYRPNTEHVASLSLGGDDCALESGVPGRQ